MRWRVLARRGWRASGSTGHTAQTPQIGARRDDALARYVVRRRASYRTTRAAAETYRVEVEKPEIISSPRARATERQGVP